MAKPELDFFDTELIPWKAIEGSTGQYEKILSKDPETDSFTRLIMSMPDLHSSIQDYKFPKGKLLCHEDHWEEVFIFKGTIIDTTLNQTFKSGSYACRPPGMKHGPFFHPTGCISFEVKTYGKMAKPELDFFDTELIPWKAIEGSTGQYEKILSKDPETDSFTRLIMSMPDLHSSIQDYKFPKGKLLCHEDHWEEVFIFKGTIIDTTLNQTFKSGSYACRPPGMKHGPFFHPTGCISFEVKTYV